MYDKKFVKFASCKIVEGFARSAIYDVGRGNYEFIPNDLVKILNANIGKTINEIVSKCKESESIIYEYFDFLVDNEYIFFPMHDDISSFPEISNQWDFPAVISNSIITYGSESTWLNDILASELTSLGCYALQLRITFPISLESLRKILTFINSTRIRQLELFIRFNPSEDVDKYKMIFGDFPQLSVMYIYNFTNDLVDYADEQKEHPLFFIKQDIIFDDVCGHIHLNNFLKNIGIRFYSESQCHNTCLNRKISIDADGNIKNCPSMQHHYGNISNTNLVDVVRQSEFRKWWYYRKDDIDVCQDCEFRHICTDCRAFIKDPNNIYSQPSKCGYNPYIALWEGQEGWISIEQWRRENPNWKEQAKENRKVYQIENCTESLKEELEHFNQL